MFKNVNKHWNLSSEREDNRNSFNIRNSFENELQPAREMQHVYLCWRTSATQLLLFRILEAGIAMSS